ncbi:MAG: hypothetical protein SGILL_010294, partial [Bacillariaceae sp.]
RIEDIKKMLVERQLEMTIKAASSDEMDDSNTDDMDETMEVEDTVFFAMTDAQHPLFQVATSAARATVGRVNEEQALMVVHGMVGRHHKQGKKKQKM